MLSLKHMNKLPLIVMALLVPSLISVINTPMRKSLLKELTTNKKWMINFVVIILFTAVIYYLNHHSKTMKHTKEEKKELEKHIEAIKKALLALVIALLVHFRLSIAPFWIVFFLAYYFDGWI